MRAPRGIPVIIASLFCLSFAASARADSILSMWSLTSRVARSPGGGSNTKTFSTVVNPFVDSHRASLAGSTSQTNYNFSGPDPLVSLLIGASHGASDVGGLHLEVLSTGLLFFQPQQDLRLIFNSHYHYDLRGSQMSARLSLQIANMDTGDTLFYDAPADNTYDDLPANGDFDVLADVVLPAGNMSFLQYTMSIEGMGTSGATATGEGSASLQIQVVPEPAASLLLALPLALLIRKRRSGPIA